MLQQAKILLKQGFESMKVVVENVFQRQLYKNFMVNEVQKHKKVVSSKQVLTDWVGWGVQFRVQSSVIVENFITYALD